MGTSYLISSFHPARITNFQYEYLVLIIWYLKFLRFLLLGFHEAVGDLLALSVSTPKHLKEIGLLEDYVDDQEFNINYLFSQAMDKVNILYTSLCFWIFHSYYTYAWVSLNPISGKLFLKSGMEQYKNVCTH